LSYVITHVLEGFPEDWQIIKFDIQSSDETIEKILHCTILWIQDAKIGKVEIKLITKEKAETK
jgi:hypothetical protein